LAQARTVRRSNRDQSLIPPVLSKLLLEMSLLAQPFDSVETTWVPQFVHCAMAVKAENARLQEHVRLLEERLKQAMMNIQRLKENGAVPLLDPRPLMGITPSTSASSSPAWRNSPTSLVPDGFVSPPGLSLPPPGLEHILFTPPSTPLQSAAQTASHDRLRLEDSGVRSAPRGPRETAEWRIENVSAKLRTSCGFPLISPSFAVPGISDLRFLFVPGDKWMAIAREKKQKGKPTRAAPASPAGPANGALKLKVGQPAQAGALSFKFFVGGVEQGPVTCDFSEMGVQGIELDVDWTKLVDCKGCLGIRFEFL